MYQECMYLSLMSGIRLSYQIICYWTVTPIACFYTISVNLAENPGSDRGSRVKVMLPSQ